MSPNHGAVPDHAQSHNNAMMTETMTHYIAALEEAMRLAALPDSLWDNADYESMKQLGVFLAQLGVAS